ncbi:MAG: ABC transporter substrate-binding protein [Balneolaceae bacterium]
MKKLLLFSVLLFSLNTLTFSQSLETGIEFYQEGDYERALRIFDEFDEPLAHLFSGKSHFGLGNYLKAKHHLSLVDSSAIEVFLEARYTRALADFQLKNFTEALDALHQIKQNAGRGTIQREADFFYTQLAAYLTIGQRYDAFKSSNYDGVRLDLVKAAMGIVDHASANALFKSFQRTVTDGDFFRSEIEQIEEVLEDTARYFERYNPNVYPEAPQGISYNIGVALPEFDFNSAEFEISQSLYLGIQIAVENFNSDNSDKKAFISYQSTSGGASDAKSVANDLVWNDDVDVILGPLFSDVAVRFSELAELYEIPMLTPLANSDSLNLDLTYTFQLNPTFSIHGTKMAQFAVRDMGFDTLAVIAEKGSLGAPSAVAFRDEARRLGAEVVHYNVENLVARGYDISEFTEYLNPQDTVYNYNIDAVYAPFTGQVASTLISSLLTYLEAMQTSFAILGTEDWESVEMGSVNLPGTNIYYSESFASARDENTMEEFESSYRLRFNMEPNYYAYVGYDAANVLLQTLKRVKNPAYLKEGLKNLNGFKGLITDVSFRGTHINQEVKIRMVRP